MSGIKYAADSFVEQPALFPYLELGQETANYFGEAFGSYRTAAVKPVKKPFFPLGCGKALVVFAWPLLSRFTHADRFLGTDSSLLSPEAILHSCARIGHSGRKRANYSMEQTVDGSQYARAGRWLRSRIML